MALSRDQMLARSTLRIERVSVPEWDGEVCVRELTAGERDRWDAWQIDHTGPERFADLRARLLIMCVCDESGARIFGDDDVQRVSGLPAVVLTRIWNVAVSLAGLAGEPEKN